MPSVDLVVGHLKRKFNFKVITIIFTNNNWLEMNEFSFTHACCEAGEKYVVSTASDTND